ncbi:MAG: stage IV sporulation protein A [Clostridiales bacterium]|nr:stage IV sporulation protein A [Clostridiales bacterium]
MEERNLYKDIATRTDSSIYIGVVGPVRSGKSTFIKKFMETLVIPNIEDENKRERALDELPQSSAGKTVMTTEPKFVPEQAVEINIGDNTSFKVRMIDCVGYVIPGANGYLEDEAPRMVRTPWSEEEIPFALAAETGTRKVITDHSTIGLVVTTDGSITDIPSQEYREAERQIISELKEINKPFIILLNTVDPGSQEAIELAAELAAEYQVPVLPISCTELDENEIKRILAQILFEFPIKKVSINMPSWVSMLDNDDPVKQSIYDSVRGAAAKAEKIRQMQDLCDSITKCECIENGEINSIDLSNGCCEITFKLDDGLFYKILSEKTGMDIEDEADLFETILELSSGKTEIDKIKQAYDSVVNTGYGIVMPTIDELKLDEPEIIRQSGKYGIRLRASAPSVHMLKTNITTEVTPIVGSEQQSEELVTYLLKEFRDDPVKIWDSNIFGKSLHELVNEGMHNKLSRMPQDARMKLCETIERIINDGCNGLICIIL